MAVSISTDKRERDSVAERHMENGVIIIDRDAVYIGGEVEIAPGAVLYPGTILEGACKIGGGAAIGPNTRMTDSTVAENATVQYSVLDRASVGEETSVGPFAYLRPGSVVGKHCKVGDFVEIKNSTVGDYTKASHLAYIGDADVGEHVNYSCGAITVNYDGKKKHRAVIQDNAFVGCNSNLIAPVTVGESAFVAAGSTVTDEVPPGALAIARQRQTNKEGWRARSGK
jgi:bifunctional UDP-N-acetylglucosamine pyrophosphorylase/glucosamine-1-phosphate N-acetyltransferase